MEQAWRSRYVRIIMVSAVVLAAAATAIVLEGRADAGSACGCAADPSCSWMSSGLRPNHSPFAGWRFAAPGGGAADWDDVQRHAFSLPVDGDGFVLKLSFYRGLGGGVTSSFTRNGLAFTFEGGAGVGGSFSVGSAAGQPEAGLAFEARASTSGRLSFVRPPDFGVTVSRHGVMRGYMDAKTGNFRTRFRTKPISLARGRAQGHAGSPVTRRSWSLGTEFKLATTYTVRVPWGGLLDLWTEVFGTVPGRAPPVPPPDLAGYVAVPDRAPMRPSLGVDLRWNEPQAAAPAGLRASYERRTPAGNRRMRCTRPRTWATPSRAGAGKAPSRLVRGDREPSGTGVQTGRRGPHCPDIGRGDL
ncbi:hypothetical protein SAMN05443665_101126 [Actinomadura meyerae]|uniref:Uncharacterized protein n=1 Tax=Actinomadura meyerae TaxID=240840 RepID=A0A239HYZ6_9ACTN|nr:hypothetical protein [Actinomadura meyerae]SNS86422.1 hypothetical protein SAMN05443665_101126 [Actinomadura meyerae]